MFGIASFAQVPFASLAGTGIVLSITEGITAADSSTQLSAFLQSKTEDVVMGDVASFAGLFFLNIDETLTSGDSSTQLSAYLQSISENSNLASVEAITAQFAASRTENVNLADSFEAYTAFSR